MLKLDKFLHLAEELVKELSEEINENQLAFIDAERKILEFVNKLGHFLSEKVLEQVAEPSQENTIWVEGTKAIYKNMGNLRFTSRFGDVIVRNRRTYKIEGESGCFNPLDEKLGMNLCSKYSPLMTYLQSFFGGSEAFSPAARKLSSALGFGLSSTAVQNNTEKTGKRLDHHPYKTIPYKKQSELCELMIVEIDGTMSPRIHEEEGLTGRESLKQPTEYKECNIIVVEKRNNGKPIDRWVGAQYGRRTEFDKYVGQTGIKIGQLQAKQVVFIADGARHNWDIQQTNFPDAVCILDYYHALEHLAEFCELYKNSNDGKQAFASWRKMIYEGRILEVMEDMRDILFTRISDSDKALKHINYFKNNLSRMEYDIYRDQDFPIGSGLVEGQCKLVVNRRFKGNGMRWKSADNDAVLDVRLAVLNNTLDAAFVPKPRKFAYVSGF